MSLARTDRPPTRHETVDEHQLVLDLGRVEAVRRAVGPTPWVVLEALAGRSKERAPVIEIESSTRDLAEVLGLSKDTVARALRALARAGLVRRVDRRSEHSGRFVATTYVVDLAVAGLMVVAVPDLSDAATADVARSSRTIAGARPIVTRFAASRLEDSTGRAPMLRVEGQPRVDQPIDAPSDSTPASTQLNLLS